MSDSDYIYAPRSNTLASAGLLAHAWQQRIAVTAASASTALAPNLAKTGWVRIKAVGADIDFTIDAAGGTLVKDAAGVGTTVGYTLQAGQAEDFYIALVGQAGFVTAIGSANGNLLIARAGKERTQLASG